MSKVFFISDHHLGHDKILQFEDRPVSDMKEHSEWIIDRHNSVVTKRDLVYFIGDVAWNVPNLLEDLPKMHGRKVLILGNHDTLPIYIYMMMFERILGSMKYKGSLVTHIPVNEFEFQYRADINIHGHLHSRTVLDPRYVNVCVDVLDGVPITLDQIKERLA